MRRPTSRTRLTAQAAISIQSGDSPPTPTPPSTMTVCIGAVCRDRDENGRNSVVVASDRMVTMAQITEFEHEVPKLTQLTDHTVALMAGDARRGMRIVRDMVAHFKVT